MSAFRSSNDVLDKPEELRRRFEQDSYLFFRRLIDREKVAALRADILNAIGALGWLDEGTDPLDAVPGPLVRREADENWWEGYAAIQSLYDFHAFPHDETLLSVARAIVGERVLVHPRSIARVTYPNSENPTPPHQDFPLIQGASDVLTTWVPLGDITPEFGGLRILSGTHREGLKKVRPADGVGGVGVEVDENDPRWLTADYRMGDVLVFHAFSVHWAPANRADRLRLSADYRYQSLDDPVVEGSLLPHGHPATPDWSELTRGWPTTAPVDPPEPLRLVDLQPPFEAQAPASRLVTLTDGS